MKEGVSVLILFTKTTSCDNCGYTFGVSVLLLFPKTTFCDNCGYTFEGQSTVYVSSKLFFGVRGIGFRALSNVRGLLCRPGVCASQSSLPV